MHTPFPQEPERPSVTYASRFTTPSAVEAYQDGMFGPGTYQTAIWTLQRELVASAVTDHQHRIGRAPTLLDFACGTGRVLAYLEPMTATSVGIDVSPQMVEVARRRCSSSELIVGDIIADPHIAPDTTFDVVTAFRFFLNAEPDTRARALTRLRSLVAPDGLLIADVHGSRRSIRAVSLAWQRWRGDIDPAMVNDMSSDDFRSLCAQAGFEVVSQHGFGVMHPRLHDTAIGRAADAVDRVTADTRLARACAIDQIFLCRPVG